MFQHEQRARKLYHCTITTRLPIASKPGSLGSIRPSTIRRRIEIRILLTAMSISPLEIIFQFFNCQSCISIASNEKSMSFCFSGCWQCVAYDLQFFGVNARTGDSRRRRSFAARRQCSDTPIGKRRCPVSREDGWGHRSSCWAGSESSING